MREDTLFISTTGDRITGASLFLALQEAAAQECEILFIHTDLNFGLPMKGVKRNELLASIMEVLHELKTSTLIFPTFTFSFCNNETYDVQNSKTEMGALNEYARKACSGIRTADPLLSVYVMGEPYNLTANLGLESLGMDSHYDRLHKCKKHVKFLFLGADMRACFTYTHYIEAILSVPYRYPRTFEGTVIDGLNICENRKAILHTTYANCTLSAEPVVWRAMSEKNQLRTVTLGGSSICCFDEADAYNTCVELISRNPYCLTDGNFDVSRKDTAYNRIGKVRSVL